MKKQKKILPRYASDMVDYVQVSDKEYDLLPICIGATVSNAPFMGHLFAGEVQRKVLRKNIVEIALRYLNAPYLWVGNLLSELIAQGLSKWSISSSE